MKYLKNENNQVFAYESDGSQDSYISEDLVAISEVEANTLLQKIQDELIAKQQKIAPQSLNRFQILTVFKLKKLNETTLYQATNDYINSLSDDTVENITAKTAWETAQDFSRDSAFIEMLKNEFNMTDKELDELFKNGADITV